MSAHNVYILPTLLFVAQLERVPKGYEEWEKSAFKCISNGPNEWGGPQGVQGVEDQLQTPGGSDGPGGGRAGGQG